MRPLLLITDISHHRLKKERHFCQIAGLAIQQKSGVIFPLMTLPGAFLTAPQGAQIRH
jgi:hypothetical protein